MPSAFIKAIWSGNRQFFLHSADTSSLDETIVAKADDFSILIIFTEHPSSRNMRGQKEIPRHLTTQRE